MSSPSSRQHSLVVPVELAGASTGGVSAQSVLQVPPGHEFHQQEALPTAQSTAEELDNVGVVDLPQNAHLLPGVDKASQRVL